MSASTAITCDGCGRFVEVPRRTYPTGWLRLFPTGRGPDDATAVKGLCVDICSADCAPAALKEEFGRVAP